MTDTQKIEAIRVECERMNSEYKKTKWGEHAEGMADAACLILDIIEGSTDAK